MTALLACPHVNVNILNSAGLTPLHVAVFKGDTDVVPGIDVEANNDGMTPLRAAVLWGVKGVAAVIADTSHPVTLPKPK